MELDGGEAEFEDRVCVTNAAKEEGETVGEGDSASGGNVRFIMWT